MAATAMLGTTRTDAIHTAVGVVRLCVASVLVFLGVVVTAIAYATVELPLPMPQSSRLMDFGVVEVDSSSSRRSSCSM